MLPYLFLAFTFEQAHSTFVKTYSLVSFCFVLTRFC